MWRSVVEVTFSLPKSSRTASRRVSIGCVSVETRAADCSGDLVASGSTASSRDSG